MPDKIQKFLQKLDAKRRIVILELLGCITAGDFASLPMKKLEGTSNRYRIRKGDIRIQFSLDEKRKAVEIEIDWRNDTTYTF